MNPVPVVRAATTAAAAVVLALEAPVQPGRQGAMAAMVAVVALVAALKHRAQRKSQCLSFRLQVETAVRAVQPEQAEPAVKAATAAMEYLPDVVVTPAM